MTVQTTYEIYPAIGMPGQIATSNHFDARSVMSATVEIPFGRVVAYAGTANAAIVKLPTAVNDKLVGFAVRSQEFASDLASDIAVNTPFSALTFGEIYVTVETAVTVGSDVHVRCVAAAAPGDQLGAVRGSADGVNTQQLANAKFLTAAAAGGIALIRISQ